MEFYKALKADINFCKILPDEQPTNLRDYVLTVVNTFTGGAFELYVKKLIIFFAEKQQEMAVEKGIRLPVVIEQTEEIQARLAL